MTPPKPSDDTTAIWVLLNLSYRTVAATFETKLRRAGLPNARWYDLLWALEREGGTQGLRQYELEPFSLFDQPNLSRTLKRMVEEGYVEQTTAKTDGRGRVFKLSPQGLKLRKEMWAVYGQLMISEIEEKVDPELAPNLIKGLQQLLPETYQHAFTI